MDGLDKSDYDREYSDSELIRRIIGYFKPYRLHMLSAITIISLGAFAAALIPVYTSDVLNGLDEDFPTKEIQTLVILVLIIADVITTTCPKSLVSFATLDDSLPIG